jgi:hypothetical protein
MNKFYTLSTDTFVPISHDNKHLFNTYELVNNFIKARISPAYRNILAKPILQNYQVEWYAPFENLKETVDAQAQRKYFAFRDELQKHINLLAQSTDADSHNWAGLLEKVFRKEDNKLFSNGKDICIVWGWAFDNYQIQRPEISIGDSNTAEEPTPEVSMPLEEPIAPMPLPEQETPEELPQEEPIPETPEEPEPPLEEPEPLPFLEPEEETPEEPEEKGNSFLEFLKEFAAKYYWLLAVLLGLICVVFFVKSLTY